MGAMEAVDGKLPLSWRFSHSDKSGPFGWSGVGQPELHEIMQKIPEFEMKTWDQLHAAGCHPIQVVALSPEARGRLAEINHDDEDALMSFHLTGQKRIWCIQQANLMRVLWWDPEHQVYPTEVDRADRKKRKLRSR